MTISKFIYGGIYGAFIAVTLGLFFGGVAAFISTQFYESKISGVLFTMAATYISLYLFLVNGVSGAIVKGFELDLLPVLGVSLVINLLAGFFLFWLSGGGWDETLTKGYFCSGLIGVLSNLGVWFLSKK